MTEFGSYEILETVARGSTGTVYRARHRDIGRFAAIKELSPQLRAVPGLVHRFRSEAMTLASLDDEHVVAVYDFVEEGDRVWIAEEWVDGVTVTALLRAHGRLTAEQSLGVLRGALLGLAHAHDRNLVHRDFGPANILADRAGTSKLVDFGLAAPVGGTGACGTPAFMSPEAARGGPVAKTSDVYSAAAVLFSLLSGRMPFPERSAEEVMRAQIEQPAPALIGHGPAMADLVAEAMSKDQGARPPDARAFLARLEEAARQRYGGDWLKRASIAGLVTALGGTGAAVVTAASTVGAAAASNASAATVFIDARATTGGVATAARRASRFSRKWMIGAGVIAAAAVAIPIAAVSLNSDNTKKPTANGPAVVDAGPATTTASTSSTTTVSQFRYRSVITKISGLSVDVVGQVFTGTWTLRSRCDAAGVCATVVSPGGSGGQFALPPTGPWRRSGTEYIRCPRVDKPQKLVFSQVLTVERGPDGTPTALKGTGHQVSTGCGPSRTVTDYVATVVPM